jgi:hypothetical protein
MSILNRPPKTVNLLHTGVSLAMGLTKHYEVTVGQGDAAHIGGMDQNVISFVLVGTGSSRASRGCGQRMINGLPCVHTTHIPPAFGLVFTHTHTHTHR